MNFFIIMGTIIAVGVGVTSLFFRKGGIYNPKDVPEDFTQIDYLKTETPPITDVTETTPTGANRPTVEAFCRAIELFEGGPGDASYRNNNPGNCRWNPGGYLPMYGNVRCSPAGFAIFPTFELGRLYLQNMVKGMIHKRPNDTILQFIGRYAPSTDGNNPLTYATFISRRLGVDNAFKVGNLV